jgi:hypothetical protein
MNETILLLCSYSYLPFVCMYMYFHVFQVLQFSC